MIKLYKIKNKKDYKKLEKEAIIRNIPFHYDYIKHDWEICSIRDGKLIVHYKQTYKSLKYDFVSNFKELFPLEDFKCSLNSLKI